MSDPTPRRAADHKGLLSMVACILIAFAIPVLAGCAAPTESPQAAPIPQPVPTVPPLPDAPVNFSRIKTELGQPLSSGLSLPDMVENAMRSLVEIRAGSSGGTGFIVNETGLVVTNKHVVQGAASITFRTVDGATYTASVAGENQTLDLAYLLTHEVAQFVPISVGDSDQVRVGEDVVIIGFPLADTLGSEPTVSQGIISARRGGMLQTDAPMNPGNSSGPMLDQFGNVIGIVVSRVEESGGRDVTGIGFAIPVNEMRRDLGDALTQGAVLPTPTPFPTMGPTPDIPAAVATLEAVDAQKRLEAQATRTAVEAEQEIARVRASLEATRIAELPTPTPEPTPTPTPTPTPHPSTYCAEWEALVLDWIYEGNVYGGRNLQAPDHPNLTAKQADRLCITAFPLGRLRIWVGPGAWSLVWEATVGTGEGQLLPGTYKYYDDNGNERVSDRNCSLRLNLRSDDQSSVALEYGKPFEFTVYTYHGEVGTLNCSGHLRRVGA